MTTTTAATRIARRRMTHAAFGNEAARRFGTDPRTWRFRCTACGHTQSAADLPPERAEHVATACFGCGRLVDQMTGDERASLLRITLPGGEKTDSFPLADALDPTPASGPHSAAPETAATPGPARGENPSAPGSAPARALTVERRPEPGTPEPGTPEPGRFAWTYRVQLTDDLAVIGLPMVSVADGRLPGPGSPIITCITLDRPEIPAQKAADWNDTPEEIHDLIVEGLGELALERGSVLAAIALIQHAIAVDMYFKAGVITKAEWSAELGGEPVPAPASEFLTCSDDAESEA